MKYFILPVGTKIGRYEIIAVTRKGNKYTYTYRDMYWGDENRIGSEYLGRLLLHSRVSSDIKVATSSVHNF